ncbi:MAG TPA: tricarballylate utilization 4Fe-4S protein TcuB [Usitatibacter sp.]|nr:tricarballylate utilization 4Fe-4S protein TcuB [Usitatibacter sp.]
MSAASALPLEELVAEAQRVLAICNACRYCEGYCAVFPALERRLEFDAADVHYLANLCHDCGACLDACQYAPPHEFALDFPAVMARVRAETYRKHAWPAALRGAFARNGVVVGTCVAASLAGAFGLIVARAGPERFLSAWSDAQGSFYALVPHGMLASVFGALFVFVLLALAVGFARFWRGTGERAGGLLAPRASGSAAHDALTLRYLDGGGDGCPYPDAKPSFARRRFHHLTFYGFLLCFAATCVAAVDHYALGWKAPYPFLSLPVLLGTAGGAGLVAGPLGLLRLKALRDPARADRPATAMDVAFLLLLLATALTGLALLALRETRAMGAALAIHLAMVFALFATLPYGKLVHAVYRFAALARYHLERDRPPPAVAPE